MDLIYIGILLVLSLVSSIKPAVSLSPPLLLSPLIHQNKTDEARRLSSVNSSLFLDMPSHAGFLTIDLLANSNTFFWFFPVQGQPVETTPWIVWLQGGPGVSSMAGLFDEIGPFEYKDGELKRRQFTWSHNHSMLFLDNPVGVGYSYTEKEEGYATNMTMYSEHLYRALQEFLAIFPELRKAPLFIAGESYAGRFVTGLGTRIMEDKEPSDELTITLEGLILGNPVMNRENIVNLTEAYYHWGLLDSGGVKEFKVLQDLYAEAVKKGQSELAFQFREQLLNNLTDRTLQQQTYNVLRDDYNNIEDFIAFITKNDIREALHVGNRTYNFRNDTVKSKLIPDFLAEVDTKVEHLLEKYKILIYCGQLDLTAPCVPNAEARRKWNWTKSEEFMTAPRVPWWWRGGGDPVVAGYVKNGGGLEEALVKGAGHLAPIDKPGQVLELVTFFIHNIQVELPPSQPFKEAHPYHQNTTIYREINTTSSTTTHKPIALTDKPDIQRIVKPVNDSLKISDTPAVTPHVAALESHGASAGTIVSIVLNIILIVFLAMGAFFYYRLRKKSQDFFYSNVESNSDDLFLT